MHHELSIDPHRVERVMAEVRAGVSARQVETGGWRLVGPLAPVTPTSIGRFRTERKALEQQVIHALVRLLGWELKGDDHFRALQRIQRRLNAFKSDLPAAEDLLLEQLALEGCGLQADGIPSAEVLEA